MKKALLTLVAVALLSTASCSRSRRLVSSPEAAKTDLDKLQGAWRIDASWWNGAPEPEAARSVTFLFQDDKFIVVDRDGNRLEERVELMADRNPKAIDHQDKRGNRSPGICSLDGETFLWCSARGGDKTRPTSFSSEPGSRRSLLILRRQQN